LGAIQIDIFIHSVGPTLSLYIPVSRLLIELIDENVRGSVSAVGKGATSHCSVVGT